jgi:hypothetical protein
MYAAVPRMTPSCVARAVIVGEVVASTLVVGGWIERFRQAEIEEFDHAIGAQLDVRRFQIPVDDALFVRRFKRVGDLPRDRQRLVERNRSLRDAIGERGRRVPPERGIARG